MKLKTLKDLPECDDIANGKWILKKTIKAEVIKWVKLGEKETRWIDIALFIKFFNITEDDLK